MKKYSGISTASGLVSRYVSQLLYRQRLLSGLADSPDVDIFYIDFAIAFDKVNHNTLVKKMKYFVIRGELLAWLTCFLSERKQTVVVEGVHSRTEKVQSGFSQGTVLGPVMFLIYLHDMEKEVQSSKVLSFADDTRLLKTIHLDDNHELLQRRLGGYMIMTAAIKLKFGHTRYTAGRNTQPTFYRTPLGQEIIRENSVKDLGEVVDD